MGQSEVIKLLEKSKVPLSAKEIADAMKETEQKISRILCILLRYNEIESVELSTQLSMKFFKCCRRMRLYYV